MSALARSLGAGVRRLAAGQVSRQAFARNQVAVAPTLKQPFIRPFSVLGSTPWQQRLAAFVPKEPVPMQSVMPPPAAASTQAANMVAQAEASSILESSRSKSMVFEIGISFVVLHYQSIFIGVMRCLFQAFRPLLILFVFGQIIKAVFFIAGAPIWMSFYSIWLFEVTYGLAQCAISFIFISFFYNNLSFARLRPTLSFMLRQHRDKMAQSARALL
eukprot:TRINITY_DN2120_c0_g3_i1.p1 TRINITY_DN2120_c0_g3~~TRINITY_DN2120_c0_g3_i1.p1  ORF type:complete len:216 (-),score=44.36 TRINITY_DN2120_c0_g3_i1:88-735(-)